MLFSGVLMMVAARNDLCTSTPQQVGKKLDEVLDLGFVYEETAHLYSHQYLSLIHISEPTRPY